MNWLTRIGDAIRSLFRKAKGEQFLCDTCRYDYGDVCRRPERPNAISCPDYKRRG